MAKNKPPAEQPKSFLPDDLPSAVAETVNLGMPVSPDQLRTVAFPDDDPYAALRNESHAFLQSIPSVGAVAHPPSEPEPAADEDTLSPPDPTPDTSPALSSMVADAARALYAGPAERRGTLDPDADPLHVRAFSLLERLYYGALLVPGAYDARESVRELMEDLRQVVCETPLAVAPNGE